MDRARLLRTLAVSGLSFLLIVGIAEAATTLSANIVTDGTLDVTGTSTLTGAVTMEAGFTNTASEALFSAGNVQLNDNVVLSLGTGNDLSIVHDGVDTDITNINGDLTIAVSDVAGSLLLLGQSVTIGELGGNVDITTGTLDINAGASFNDAVAFSDDVDFLGINTTFTAGFTVSGSEALFSDGNVQLNDNIVLSIGTGDDLSIAHDGASSEITNSTGDLNISSGSLTLETNGGGGDTITINGNAVSDEITIGSGIEQLELVDDQWSILENGTASFTSVTTGGGVTIGNGTEITAHYSDEAVADFGVIATNDCDELTFIVTSATVGDTVAIGLDPDMLSGNETTYTAYVSAVDTVTLRACNVSAGAATADLPAGDIRIDVWVH